MLILDGVMVLGKLKTCCSQLINYKFPLNTTIFYIYVIMYGTCGNILTIFRHSIHYLKPRWIHIKSFL